MKSLVRPALPAGKHDRRPGRPAGRGTVLTPVTTYEPLQDLWLVRIAHIVEPIDGFFQDAQMTRTTDVFLSGRQVEVLASTRRFISQDSKELPMAQALINARTGNITDWGRFEQACVALTNLVREVGDDGTPEQQEEILRSYQNLLTWREALRTKVEAADAALDIAQVAVRSAF